MAEFQEIEPAAAGYGVAFDLDGTLFDSRSISQASLYEGLKAFWEELGEEGPSPNWETARGLIGLPSYEFFPALLPESHKRLWRLLHSHIGRCESGRLREGRGLTFDGVHETLSELRKSGYFLGCLSNASSRYFNDVLDWCDLRKYFLKLNYLGENPEVGKEDILREWSADLGGADKLVYVGDRMTDIRAARMAGVGSVAVSFGYGTYDELKGADMIIVRMSDLPDVLQGFFRRSK